MQNVWYLAHPVASDRHYSYEENMAHALRCARAVWDAGYRHIMPWYVHCLFLDDANEEHRDAGIAVDHLLLPHCHGIILTGHRLSNGMADELRTMDLWERPVINLVGLPSGKIASHLRSLKR